MKVSRFLLRAVPPAMVWMPRAASAARTLPVAPRCGTYPTRLCERLSKTHGPRFKPNRLLRDLAKTGDTFYGRFAGKRPSAAA